MIIIIPSILTDSTEELAELIGKSNGVADRVSVDIIDGKFAGNKTIEPDALSNIETDLIIDYQLMVLEPISWIERCVKGKASQIIGHIEHMSSQSEFIDRVLKHNIKPGLGLDLKTPIDNIDQPTLHSIETILLMSVPAGFGGQTFRDEVIKKIEILSQLRDRSKYSYKIHIDGGITPSHLPRLEELGVDEVSIGKRLFEGSMQDNIDKFINHD